MWVLWLRNILGNFYQRDMFYMNCYPYKNHPNMFYMLLLHLDMTHNLRLYMIHMSYLWYWQRNLQDRQFWYILNHYIRYNIYCIWLNKLHIQEGWYLFWQHTMVFYIRYINLFEHIYILLYYNWHII